MLDGRIARMTGSSSAFGVEFDSMADLISFGMAPAVLTFQWGLWPLGRLGWAVGFLYLTAAAVRLARFNIQHVTDKRYFVGMPSPSAAGVPAATIFFLGEGLTERGPALLALAMLMVPALLMVSTFKFRSLKTMTCRRPSTRKCSSWWRRPSRCSPPRPMSSCSCWPTAISSRRSSNGASRDRAGALRQRQRRRRSCPTSPRRRRIRTRRIPICSAPARQAAGSHIETVVPTPAVLVTSIVPPFSSTLRRAIVRPSPVPVALVEK